MSRVKIIGETLANVPWQERNKEDKKALVLLPKVNKNVYLSARNIQRADVMLATALNSYKVLNADVLVLTESSLEAIDGVLNK